MLALKVLEFVAALKAGDVRKAGRVLAEILAIVFAEATAQTEDTDALAAAVAEADAACAETAGAAKIGDGKLLEKLLLLWDIVKKFL